MVILNVKLNKAEKDRIKKIVSNSEYSTISEFVRAAIDEKLRIEEVKHQSDEINIPDWIPDGHYYALVKGAIVGVGETPSALMADLITKFPFEHIIIKRNNKKFPQIEYAYSVNTEKINCWSYLESGDQCYPIIPLILKNDVMQKTLPAIPDTAASLTLIKSEIVNEFNLEQIDLQRVQTASGITNLPIYQIDIQILGQQIPTKIISAPVSELFPFQGMIGRNLLDIFDLYLLGKRKIICLKD